MQWRMRLYAYLALRSPAWNAASLASYFAGIKGDMPHKPQPAYIFTACDDNYFRQFGLAFILSAEDTAAPQALHLHIYSPSDATLSLLDGLADKLTHVTLSHTWDEHKQFESFRFKSIPFAALRFVLAHLLLSRTRSSVFCLDVDGLIRKPVAPALSAMAADDADISFISRFEKKNPHAKTMIGALLLRPSPHGLNISSAFARMILALLTCEPDGHIDQAGLYFLYNEEVKRHKTAKWQHQLSRKFCDHDYTEEGIVWTAKGTQKDEEYYRDLCRALELKYKSLTLSSAA